MAAKNKIVYICSNCGFESAKWAGKCPDCGEWNTMEESVKTAVSAKSAASGYTSSASTLLTRPLAISEIDTEDEHRYHTGLSELDRVLGGGLVKGSLVLISGDPGIGKSTILLQICEYLGQKLRILYVSGEESARQIKLRAGRLGVSSPNLAHFGGNGRAACGGAHSHRKTGYRDDRLHPNDELYRSQFVARQRHTGARMHERDHALLQVARYPGDSRRSRQQRRRHRGSKGVGAPLWTPCCTSRATGR